MDLIDLSRILFALVAVLGLIGLIAIVARKAGLASGGLSFSAHKRLSTIETMSLDARRRVVIIKCDDREHLILLSNTGETLVDANLPTAPNAKTDEDTTPAQTFGEAMKKLTDLGRGANPFAEQYAASREVDPSYEEDHRAA